MTYVLVSKTLKLVCLGKGVTMFKDCGGFFVKCLKTFRLQK
jgi:hypothetical protein